ncbi:hypothetical protein N9997_01270 [Synechococcus sp. AH-603-L18]|nr:hypothetical protein [Synechococcus sp. AH-603-L18]MDB4337952.1 hypothetical protein [Synechococcus sp. AH-603-L18]
MKRFSLILFLAVAATGIASSANAESCPANIGDYGYQDGRGGSFGETLMALGMNRPHCICKLSPQWVKEWYYSEQPGSSYYGPETERIANGERDFGAWIKRCNPE